LGTFVIIANDTKYAAFDFKSGEKLIEVPNLPQITSLTIHPDGCILVTGHSNGKIMIWDIRESRQMK